MDSKTSGIEPTSLLRPADVAKVLLCSERYVRILLAAGKLDYVCVGRLRRVEWSALQRYISENKVIGGVPDDRTSSSTATRTA
jgi:excisionase family DNA binding protein